MKFVCALIAVKDIEHSKKFYQEVLGQKIKFDFGENVSFEGDFAIHQKDHFSFLIENREIIPNSNSFELYFENDDLTSLFHTLKTYEVQFIHEIREQPWRQQVMRFYDPDGTIIEVGESMEHLCKRLSNEGKSNTEISKVTSLPVEYIKSVLQN